MKKTAMFLLTLAMILMTLTASAAVGFPFYEGYPVCVDGNLWIEVPNAYEAMDMTIDYPCMYLISEKMDMALVAKVPENYKRSWLSQSADLSGFRQDGIKVLSGADVTEASTVIERSTINDLPAVRVDMTGQGYEMIWVGDSGDMYFVMYPLADEVFAQDMRDVAASMHLVKSNTPVFTEASAFEYTVDDNGVTITAYIGDRRRVAIPAEIDGKPVVALGDSAFYESRVTWVDVPDSVKSIGTYCFSGCTFLQTLNLPEGLTELPAGMLESCFRLPEITIPDSVTTIGESVFWGNFYLSELRLPTSLTTIKGFNFVMAEYLERFIVSEENTAFKTLDDGAVLFGADGKRLIHYCAWQDRAVYTVPASVETIDAFAFADWGALTEIIVPEGVTAIEGAAFINARYLEKLTLPASAVELGHTNVVGNAQDENGEEITVAGSADSLTAVNMGQSSEGVTAIAARVTIIAPEGSAAQAHAEQFQLTFQAADAADEVMQE